MNTTQKLPAYIDPIVDQFSIHQPRGGAKGTVARRVLKKKLHKAVESLLNEIEGSDMQQQIRKQEQGERIYQKTLDGMPKLMADTPVTYVVMEFQKSLRRALIDEDFLTMIEVDGEWTKL